VHDRRDFRVDGIPLSKELGDALHALIVHTTQCRTYIGVLNTAFAQADLTSSSAAIRVAVQRSRQLRAG